MAKKTKLKRSKVTGVYVMPDYCSSGLWNLDGNCMLYPEEVGLSKEITKALDKFVEYYDCEATARPSYCPKKSHEKRLNHMGRLIAERVKAERPDLEVECWSEYHDGKLKKEKITGARSSVGRTPGLHPGGFAGSSPVAPTKTRRKR